MYSILLLRETAAIKIFAASESIVVENIVVVADSSVVVIARSEFFWPPSLSRQTTKSSKFPRKKRGRLHSYILRCRVSFLSLCHLFVITRIACCEKNPSPFARETHKRLLLDKEETRFSVTSVVKSS